MSQKLLPGIFLLRKSKVSGEQLPVMKETDLPARFVFGGRAYELNKTKAGKLIMVAIPNT